MITIIAITVVSGILVGFSTNARTLLDGKEDLARNIVVAMAGAFLVLQIAGGVFGSAGK